MSSDRCLSFIRHTALVCAAFAFCAGSASAQISATPEYSSSLSVPSVYSSSNSMDAANAGALELNALPAAPDPKGGGGGQYDNRSRGGGGRSGIMSHLTYEVGGGFNAPTGDSSPYIGWGGNFTVGAGYRWNKNLSLNLEYQYIDSKLPGAIIAEAGASGGYDHIWSFTVDPMYEVNPKSAITFYAVGGGGFYRKVTSFTDPTQGEYCDYFGYCYGVTQNQVVGHFSSNQGGWSVGGGLEHRFAGWNGDGKMKIFAEARYLDVLSPAVNGLTPNGLGVTTVGEDTKIVPVTVGLRW
ncbi:MAG TPA: outer membrane beta-barrel protein [Terracidiphilus sp.]